MENIDYEKLWRSLEASASPEVLEEMKKAYDKEVITYRKLTTTVPKSLRDFAKDNGINLSATVVEESRKYLKKGGESNEFVKVTLTIPSDIDREAEEKGIDIPFSYLLRRALEELKGE